MTEMLTHDDLPVREQRNQLRSISALKEDQKK
jgi:hypothetical protein